MRLSDFVDGIGLVGVIVMMLSPVFLWIALHMKRNKPKDWVPCEAWIVVGIVALAWALKAAE